MDVEKLWPWGVEGAEPAFTNDKYHWWIEEDLTRYMNSESVTGDTCPPGIVFLLQDIETKEPETRIIMDKKTNEVLKVEKGIEAISCWIDAYKIASRYE